MPRTIIAVIACAVLLLLAFPQTGWWGLAWVAFVPLFYILDGKSTKSAFGWGYLYGYLFFFGAAGWLVYVTYAGAILLMAYLALYLAIFAAAIRFFIYLPLMGRVLVLPSVFVVLEYLRAHLFTGYGWALLGHSQYKNIVGIQIADITGVYGVSFLIMLVNVVIYESLTFKSTWSQPVATLRRAQVLAVGLVAVVFTYGACTLYTAHQTRTITVEVVQPNIPQEIKWDPDLQTWIVQTTIHETTAITPKTADLIVWPETSLPGVLSDAPYLVGAIKLAARNIDTPILIGSITDENHRYYNSAYLISPAGTIDTRYDKIHLVPFGEYIPLRPILGWVNEFVPMEDFTSGTEYTLFDAGKGQVKSRFGVLICFEDTVSRMHRNFALKGAEFMVNMTNDAWFKDTKAPFLHMAAALFCSVENKRALVRSSNTGFSGIIDPWGRIIAAVHNAQGKQTFINGTTVSRVPLMTQLTFYTKYGDIFTWGCLFAILWAVINRSAAPRRRHGIKSARE